MNDQKVVVLALCEAHNVILKPDTLYRFEIVEGCNKCKEYAK